MVDENFTVSFVMLFKQNGLSLDMFFFWFNRGEITAAVTTCYTHEGKKLFLS